MKKIALLIVAFLLLFSAIMGTNTVLAADLSDKIVIRLVANHTESQIDVDVSLRTNTGILDMVLELDYDKSVFQLTGFEQGTALVENFVELSDADDIATVTKMDSERTTPIRFCWLNKTQQNDFSEGLILKLHFNLLLDAPSGEHTIGFKYNGEPLLITYYDQKGSSGLPKSAIISKAVVKVEENKITQTDIVEENSQSNVFMVLGITIGSALVVSAAVFAVIKIKREKVRKKNWIKI